MGVYEQDRHPFLRQEIRLIRDALNEHRPVLGNSLGSQFLATAHGSPATCGEQKQIGWHSVTLSRATAKDALWRGFPASFVAYHWHGDVFELSSAATALASSKLTEHQAFRCGNTAYGILFHLEVTNRIIRRMTRTFERELRDAGMSARLVLDKMSEHLPMLQALGRKVFERWAALVEGGRPAESKRQMLRVKRVYESSASDDGARFLVERLWPRGMKKEELRMDGWLKAIAPSDALRRWFNHDPARCPEFRPRYFAELDQHPESTNPSLDAAARGPVTLLFSAKTLHQNNAVALADYCRSMK